MISVSDPGHDQGPRQGDVPVNETRELSDEELATSFSYLDAELEGAEAAETASHLMQCTECRARLGIPAQDTRRLVLVVEDFLTDVYAFVADIHGRTGNELFDLFLGLATERTLKITVSVVSPAIHHKPARLSLASRLIYGKSQAARVGRVSTGFRGRGGLG